jgi:hypothetical protein
MTSVAMGAERMRLSSPMYVGRSASSTPTKRRHGGGRGGCSSGGGGGSGSGLSGSDEGEGEGEEFSDDHDAGDETPTKKLRTPAGGTAPDGLPLQQKQQQPRRPSPMLMQAASAACLAAAGAGAPKPAAGAQQGLLQGQRSAAPQFAMPAAAPLFMRGGR